jgi:hypothetical protein
LTLRTFPVCVSPKTSISSVRGLRSGFVAAVLKIAREVVSGEDMDRLLSGSTSGTEARRAAP